MKALACEMCGSNDVVKQDGLYVCQHCGTKYTLEEARKLMIEGAVDVTGSIVKIDASDELSNLYELARRAKFDNNTENAEKYYDMILVKDPNSWEATFYQVYFKAMNCRLCDIGLAASSVTNCLVTVFTLIDENIHDVPKKEEAVCEVIERCIYIGNMLFSAAKNNYDNIDSEIRSDFTQEMIDRCYSSMSLLYLLGDSANVMFAEYKEIQYFIVVSWKDAIKMHCGLLRFVADKKANIDVINSYEEKIKKIDDSYKKPELNTGGCYIATCVYGSYDCPEVWVLRRFRDNVLAKSIFGKAFISIYYFVSPKIVNAFGENNTFKTFCRKPLSKLIKSLKEKGFKDTQYEDDV